MTWMSLHASVNHFPIVLVVIGAIAVLLAAMIQRRAIWIYALATLTLAGLAIYPAWWTGERARHVVDKAWYILPGAIHSHSQAADVSLWAVGITGALAFISLIVFLRVPAAVIPARGFRILVGLGALASIGSIAYTGFLGGRIVVDSPILANPVPPVISGTQSMPDSGAHVTSPALPGATSPGTVPQSQQQTAPQSVPQTQPLAAGPNPITL